MFAGPNGSGKSTLKEEMPAEWLGYYLNPDEIEKKLRLEGGFDFSRFGLDPSLEQIREHFRKSPLPTSAVPDRIGLAGRWLSFDAVGVNSYLASVLTAFLRQELVRARATFSFETVMSSPDKVDFLRKSRDSGYRTYLYFIATEDPDLNVARVQERVRSGGHDVPEEKIRSRYVRSLELLLPAIKASTRAYLFDNSGNGQRRVWIAEVTNGTELEVKVDAVPAWFRRCVLDRIR